MKTMVFFPNDDCLWSSLKCYTSKAHNVVPTSESILCNAAPLPESILRLPARTAVKALQVRCLNILADDCNRLRYRLSRDAVNLLDTCQALEKSGYKQEWVDRLAGSELLHSYAETLTEILSYNDLLKLALLTWHFDGSFNGPKAPPPSRELLMFLSPPTYDCEQLCKTRWERYNHRHAREDTLEDFGAEFVRLLSILEYEFGLVLFVR